MGVSDRVMVAARTYAAEHGLKVFPVGEDKKPACMRGHNAATKKDKAVCKMFEQCEWGQGIGIRTGQASGILVLDVDTKKKDELGYDPLDWLVDKFGDEWQDTLVARTPSNGYHFYFRLAKGTHVGSVTALFQGVDIKCDGGYVVASPTKIPEGEYRWETGEDVPENFSALLDAPDWLLESIRKKSPSGGNESEEYDESGTKFIRTVSFPLLKSVFKDALKNVRRAKKGRRKVTLSYQSWRLGMWIPYGLDLARAKTALLKATESWGDIDDDVLLKRVDDGIRDGVRTAYQGKGPSIPDEERKKWEEDDFMLEKRRVWLKEVETWLLDPESTSEGVTLDEVLESNFGWESGFRGKKAAKNELAKLLRSRGFKLKQVRINGMRVWLWLKRLK